MKTNLFAVVTLAVLCAVLAPSKAQAQDQSYVNTDYKFSMTLPDNPTVLVDKANTFVVAASSSDVIHNAGVAVSNDYEGTPTERLSQYVKDSESDSNTFHDCASSTLNGDPVVMCDDKFTRKDGIKTTGKEWMCVHNGYIYDVWSNTSNGSDVMPYLNSFKFLD